jgi:hypothetical protein
MRSALLEGQSAELDVNALYILDELDADTKPIPLSKGECLLCLCLAGRFEMALDEVSFLTYCASTE